MKGILQCNELLHIIGGADFEYFKNWSSLSTRELNMVRLRLGGP